MKRAILICAALACGPALAQLHKCIGSDGRVHYADQACPTAYKPGAITAARPAAPTASDAEAAQKRREVANQQSAEIDRKRAQDAANSRAIALDSSRARVAQIKAENADPKRCAASRGALAAMRSRDPVGYRMDVSAFEFQQQIALYCGN